MQKLCIGNFKNNDRLFKIKKPQKKIEVFILFMLVWSSLMMFILSKMVFLMKAFF